MPFNTNLAQEATTLTKWLISIPSVAHAKGPALISQAIYEGLSEFPYFKNHPEHLTLQAHENSAKSSVIALVKGLDDVQDTLVLLCHTDTNSPYHYGMLKGLSTNADELRKRLLEMSGSPLLNNKSNNSLIATDSSDSDLANPQASKQGSSMSAALNSAESAKASSATTGDSASTGASSAGASASSAYKTTGTTEAPESEESSPLSVGSNSILSGALKRALARDEAILGLGILESKCATGSMLVALKELSDNSVRLNLNILFICTSESSINHKGIKSCMPYLQELVQKEHLKLRLCLNAQPNLPQLPHDGDLHVYTGNYGKIEPSFYIIGNSSTSYRPYEGFSASIIAAELIRALELNPKITQKLQHKPLVPTFDSLRVKEFGKDFSPDGMQVSFNLPIGNVDLADLLETLKEVAATAIENAADLVEVREAAFAQMRHEEYTPTAKDAEVVSFSDLLERASHNFKGNLHKALQGMVQKCRSEGLSLHQASITIIERLNELARLPRPSIVVYYTDNFVPTQGLNANSSQDRELFMILDGLLHRFAKVSPIVPTVEAFYAPSDANFLRPEHVSRALKTLEHECPLGINAEHFQGLSVPTVTLGVGGGDLSLLTEHVFSNMCQYLPAFVISLSEALAQNPEHSLETPHTDDLQRHLEELGRRAASIADATVQEIQTVEKQKQNLGFYADVTQGTLTPHSLDSFIKPRYDQPDAAAAAAATATADSADNSDSIARPNEAIADRNAKAPKQGSNKTALDATATTANESTASDQETTTADSASATDTATNTSLEVEMITPAAQGEQQESAASHLSTTDAATAIKNQERAADAIEAKTEPVAEGDDSMAPSLSGELSVQEGVQLQPQDAEPNNAVLDGFIMHTPVHSTELQTVVDPAALEGDTAQTAAAANAANTTDSTEASSSKAPTDDKADEKEPELESTVPSPLQGNSPAAAALAAANKAQMQAEARALAAAARQAQRLQNNPHLQTPEVERDSMIIAPVLGGDGRGEPILEPTQVTVMTVDGDKSESLTHKALSAFNKFFKSGKDSDTDSEQQASENKSESSTVIATDTTTSASFSAQQQSDLAAPEQAASEATSAAPASIADTAPDVSAMAEAKAEAEAETKADTSAEQETEPEAEASASANEALSVSADKDSTESESQETAAKPAVSENSAAPEEPAKTEDSQSQANADHDVATSVDTEATTNTADLEHGTATSTTGVADASEAGEAGTTEESSNQAQTQEQELDDHNQTKANSTGESLVQNLTHALPLNKIGSFFNKLDLKSALNKLQEHTKSPTHHHHHKKEPIFMSGSDERSIDVSDPYDEQEPTLAAPTTAPMPASLHTEPVHKVEHQQSVTDDHSAAIHKTNTTTTITGDTGDSTVAHDDASASDEHDQALRQELDAIVHDEISSSSDAATDAVIKALHQESEDTTITLPQDQVPQRPDLKLQELLVATTDSTEPTAEATEAESEAKPKDATQAQEAAAERQQGPEDTTDISTIASIDDLSPEKVAELMAPALKAKFATQQLASIDAPKQYPDNGLPLADGVYANSISVDVGAEHKSSKPQAQEQAQAKTEAAESDSASANAANANGATATDADKDSESKASNAALDLTAEEQSKDSKAIESSQSPAHANAESGTDAEAEAVAVTDASTAQKPADLEVEAAEDKATPKEPKVQEAAQDVAQEASQGTSQDADSQKQQELSDLQDLATKDLSSSADAIAQEQAVLQLATQESNDKESLSASATAQSETEDDGNNNDLGLKRYDPAQAIAQLLFDDDDEEALAAKTAHQNQIDAKAAAEEAALKQAEAAAAKANSAITDLMDTLLGPSEDEEQANSSTSDSDTAQGSPLTATSSDTEKQAEQSSQAAKSTAQRKEEESTLNAYTAHIRSRLNHHSNGSNGINGSRLSTESSESKAAPSTSASASANAVTDTGTDTRANKRSTSAVNAPDNQLAASRNLGSDTKMSLSERRAALRRAMYGEDSSSSGAFSASANKSNTKTKISSPSGLKRERSSSYGLSDNGLYPSTPDLMAPVAKSSGRTNSKGSYIDLTEQGEAVSYDPAALTKSMQQRSLQSPSKANNGNSSTNSNRASANTNRSARSLGSISPANATRGTSASISTSASANNAFGRTNRNTTTRTGSSAGAGAAYPNALANSRMGTTESKRSFKGNGGANNGTMSGSTLGAGRTIGSSSSSNNGTSNSQLARRAPRTPPLAQTIANAPTLHPPVSNPNKTRIEKKDTKVQPVQAVQPHNPANDAMEPVAASNPGVRIVRSKNATPQAITTTPNVSNKDKVVYAQGGAVMISKRITADQASSLLNHEDPTPEPTSPIAIVDHRKRNAASDTAASSSDENLPTTIVVRGK